MSSAHPLLLALPSALAADPRSQKPPPCPTTRRALPAHASVMASLAVATASSSTVVDPAAATPMRNRALPRQRMSSSMPRPAAKASSSADKRLTLSSIGRLKPPNIFACLCARKPNPLCAVLSLRRDDRWCILCSGITFLTTIFLCT
jgi:hypothetical protein